MIFSGVMMVKLNKREKGVHNHLTRKYDGLNLNKFLISLLMTPFFERIVTIVTGRFNSTEADANAENWQIIFTQVKFGLIIGLFGYSTYIRKFREDHDNFEDKKAVKKMLVDYLKKIS